MRRTEVNTETFSVSVQGDSWYMETEGSWVMNETEQETGDPHPGGWTHTVCHQNPGLGQRTQLTTSSDSQAREEDTPIWKCQPRLEGGQGAALRKPWAL